MKNLKLILLSVLFLLANCTPKSNNSNQNPTLTHHQAVTAPTSQSSDETEDGGISAGGGGTLPTNPIPQYRVTELVGGAKRLLRLYYNYSRHFRDQPLTSNEKYFYGENNLSTQLEKTDIEILENKACLNKFGKEVDASIYASRPNTICISAFNIAPKIIEETAGKEISALLTHELSHFLGASEEEATDLQKWTLIRLKALSSNDIDKLEEKMWNLTMENTIRFNQQKFIEESINANDLQKTRTELNGLLDQLRDYSKELDGQPFKFIDYSINQYEDIIKSKIILAIDFINSTDPNNPDQAWAKKDYDLCFSGKTELKVGDTLTDCNIAYLRNNIYPDYTIKKLSVLSDLKSELNDVFQYVEDLNAQARAISFDQVIPFFNLPNNQVANPWDNYIGKYSAQLLKCSGTLSTSNPYDEDALTALEIFKDKIQYPVAKEDQIFFKEINNNVTFIDAVYNGALSNGGTVKVSGDAISATVISESGTRWYDRQGHGYSKKSRHIEKTTFGDLQLTLRRDQFRYDWNGVRESFSECTYSLVKN